MSKAQEHLLPCPMCGGTEILVKKRKTTMVECKACGLAVFNYQDGIERDAIAHWNRRPASSEQQAAQHDAEFELWQDDMVVASVFGPREQSVAEIMRYAEQYAQDGEVRIEEVIRIPFDAARASNGGKA